jgi:DNA primase
MTPKEIMDLINQTGLKYTDHGDYIKFRCINPGHTDKNPSMTMLKVNGYARCWACGISYSFAQLYEKLTGKKIQTKQSPFYLGLTDIMDYYHGSLFKQRKQVKYRTEKGELYNPKISPTVMKYLSSIYVDEETIEYFDIKFTNKIRIGFNPNQDTTFIKDRICIPIVENNELVNMECRDFTGAQALKVIYPKGSKADVLFNCDSLSRKEPLIVVEGIKSALRIWRYISRNVTATLGSAIGREQREKLNTFKDVILFPDNDRAGKEMIEQFETFYEGDYQYTFMKEEGYDPADGTLGDLKEALENLQPSTRYRVKEVVPELYKKNTKVSWESCQ